MKTVFDLRVHPEASILTHVKHLFGEDMKVVSFDSKSITPCIGCWDCWLKTPGRCVINDAMSQHYHDYMNSEHVIVLCDTAQGFIHHSAKAFIDRSIPHYLPYIELIDGECNHVPRYAHYPKLTFYFDADDLSAQEEVVIEDYLYRTAYQYKSKAFRLVKGQTLTHKPLVARKPQNKQHPYVAYPSEQKLIIYLGSPRLKNSNSSIILDAVAHTLGDRVEIRDLKQRKHWEAWRESFKKDERVLFFLPLYVHAMPSHVMAFIETLEPSPGGLAFFVQSGFPESCQSYYLEAYVEVLSLRLKRHYAGTAIKGGMEGLQMRPPQGQTSLIQPLVNAIVELEKDGKFNEATLKTLAHPVRYGRWMRIMFTLIGSRLMNRFFWNMKLKNNQAYAIRLQKPYDSKI